MKPGCKTCNDDHSTRRQFLAEATKLSGIALTGSVLTTSLRPHVAVGADDANNKKVRYALVGLGSLATNQLAPALQKTEHSQLVGIVTGTPAKEKIWADKYGIARQNIYNYATFDRIADNPDIDVIYIVLPNSMHAEYTIRAAQAGKHVLCEKPMGVSAAECRDMIVACEKADRLLAIGYRCQFEPHHLACIRMARENQFGATKMIDAGFGFRIGDPNQWRLKKDLAGGGALMDVGIYALQACRYLTDEEPRSIVAQETKTDEEKFAEVDETITWSMKFPSGIIANCSTTYNFRGVNRYSVYADEGSFGLDPAFSYGGIKGWSSLGKIDLANIDQFAAEIDDFSQCVLSGRKSKVSGEEGLRDLVAIEAIYESIRTGRVVELA